MIVPSQSINKFQGIKYLKNSNQPSKSNFLDHKLLQIHFAQKNVCKLFFKTIASTSISPQEASDFFMSTKIFFEKNGAHIVAISLAHVPRFHAMCHFMAVQKRVLRSLFSALKASKLTIVFVSSLSCSHEWKKRFSSVIISNWLFMTV